PLGAVSTMAAPEERGGRGAGGSGEAQAQGQHRDSAMAPMQPSLGPPRDEPRVFGLDKFNGVNFAEWSFKMENIFDHYHLLEVMEGTEKRPENDPEKSPWAWAALKGVHAPATAAVAVVLERQMAALRIEEDEAVEEGVQKFFDLLTRLEGADLNYSELQKKTKLLALLPESWSSLIINLNRDLPRLSLEDVKRAILQEDFRCCKLVSADGARAASIGRGYGRGRGRGQGGGRFGSNNFNGGRGSGGYGSDNKNYRRGRGRFDSECHYCHKSGHMWRDCYKLPDGSTPAQGQEGRGAGGGRERGRGGRGGGAASVKSAGNESESRDDRFPGQFFFVSSQASACPEKDEGLEEPAAVGKVTLHSLDYWVIDSGATYSMTPRADLLTELEPSPVKHVTSALGQRAEVKGMGKTMFKGADGKMVGLKNVLWVPNLVANLISVRRLQKAGMDTSSKGAKTYTARLGERILLDLHEDRDVYNEMWQIPVVPMPKERQVAASISTKGEAVGSGDGANGRAKEMKSRSAILEGLASSVITRRVVQQPICNTRMRRTPRQQQRRSTERACAALLRVRHSPIRLRLRGSVIGSPWIVHPLPDVHASHGAAGEEYFLTIVDVYSRMTRVYVLSKKSDVTETVKTDWLPMVERQQDRLVKAIRTDRGGEFLSKEFSLWLKKNGIRHSLSIPYSPAMNGIAERANRTITETARGLLIEAGLPDYFWPDAVRSACVAKNRALTYVRADKWVPYVEWIGRKPKVDMLRVFGCMSMALVPKHLRHNKLGAKAIWAVHLGMAQHSKGWFLWDPFTKKLLVSRDCKFMENLMYKDWKAENEAKIGMRFGEVKSSGLEHVELPLELSSSSTTTRQSSLVNGGEEAKDAEEEEEEVQQVSERAPTLPSRTTSAPRTRVTPQQRQGLHVPAAKEEGRGKRRIQAPNRLIYEALGKPAKSALAGVALIVGDDEESDYDKCAFSFFSPVEMPGEPATLKEALESSDAEEWKKAMESELKSIEENGTWELVELPKGRKAITSKWLFKIKTDADGKIERYKSRLVAKGYQQKEKVDYKELFAPVVKPTTLRTLLAGAAIKGWVVKQMDVTTAFLNGVFEEEIFMEQPEGFDDGSGRVLRLKKALYGLKQAPRQWYLKLRGVLEEIGFTPSTADHSLFMLGEGEQRSFMVVYVDDILIFSLSSDLVKEVMLKLQDKFKCKALGDVSFYLGLHIERDVEKRCMRVHQRKYLEALAANFGQSEGHVAIAFPSGFKCVKGPEEESVGEEERRCLHSLVGSLMYAAVNTRPDVVFATGQDDKEVSCSLVGVVEPTVLLAPKAGEDFQVMAAAVQANPALVVLDSGCPHHLMGTKEVFVDLQQSGGVKHVRGFNGALQDVQGHGTVSLEGEAGRQLKENGVKLQKDGNGMLLVLAAGDVLGQASYTGRVLCIDLHLCSAKLTTPTTEVVALRAIVSVTKSTPNRLHARLAHVGMNTIRSSANHEVATGLDLTSASCTDLPCVSCVGGKLAWHSFPDQGSDADDVLALMHVDLCGPFRWLAVTEQQMKKPVLMLRSHRGGEFLRKQFIDFVNVKGIVHDLTCPYTSQQNGMAERDMRTVVESPRTTPYQLLTDKKPGLSLARVWGCMAQFLVPEQQRGGNLKLKARWGLHLDVSKESKGWELLDIADNRVVITSLVVLYENMSLEVWKLEHGPASGRTPTIPPTDTSTAKLPLLTEVGEAAAEDVEDVPFPSPFPAPRAPPLVADLRGLTLVLASSDEGRSGASPVVPAKSIAGGQRDVQQVDVRVKLTPTEEEQAEEVQPTVVKLAKGAGTRQQLTGEEAAAKPTKEQSATGRLAVEQSATRRSAGTLAVVLEDAEGSNAGGNEAEQADAEESTNSNEVEFGPRRTGRLRRPPDFFILAAFTTGYNEVDDDLLYDDAKEEEDLPELDPDMHADLEHRWDISMMTVKEALASWKGKAVYGADYDKTFAPVSSYITLRIFLSIVTVLDLNLMHLDMKNAFLQSKLDRVLYMYQLDDFNDGTGRVCKLLKSLYGLKRSPLLWYMAPDGMLLGAVLRTTLYFKVGDDKVTCWVLVYVDDLLAASSSAAMLKELKELLKAAFELREISAVQKYLGLEIMRDRSWRSCGCTSRDMPTRCVGGSLTRSSTGAPRRRRGRRLLDCATLSSTELEYVAAIEAGKEGRRLRSLLAEFRQLDAMTSTVTRVDNKSAITVAEGMGLTSNLKHMERRQAWLQHMVKREKFLLRYILTTKQPADFLTKALHYPAFNRCSVAIGQVRLVDVGDSDNDVQQ
ncbi:unnamed protein product, partial [Closterium sp. NIES-54]